MKYNVKHFLLLLGMCSIPVLGARAEDTVLDYVPDEVIVLFGKDSAALPITLYSEDAQVVFESSDERAVLMKLDEKISVEQAIAQYEEIEGVIDVVPNYILELYEESSGKISNDGDAHLQKYLQQISVEEAWEYLNERSHEKVRIAVLDTGADIEHPELKNVLNLELSKEVLDSQGTLGPLLGDDYKAGVKQELRTDHGTHTCGIIAAEVNNQLGIAGVASCIDNSVVELVAVDVFSGYKNTTMAHLIHGLQYAAEQKVKVISMSLGVDASKVEDDYLLKAICDEIEKQGITIVCAGGNSNKSDDGQVSIIPADYDSVIGVVAVNAANQKASFSNYGTKKDIAAPGESIYSLTGESGYGYKSGTSQAAPMVAAAAGMVYSLNPDMKPDEMKMLLKGTAEPNSDEKINNLGILNCRRAVQASDYVIRNMPFSDAIMGGWYYWSVVEVYNRQLMTGMTEDYFGVEEQISRAQFSVILHRMNGGNEAEYRAVFPDVEADTWYTDAVLWANDNQIVTGYTHNGLFGPADMITREQIAVMMYRYAKMQGEDVDSSAELTNYPDASEVSMFAREAMEWTVAEGIITGKEDGRILDPQSYATRAECATIIMRYIRVLEDK